MPIPRKLDQFDRLTENSLPSKAGKDVWKRYRKYLSGETVVFPIRLASDAKVISKYQQHFERHIAKATGYHLSVDWEFKHDGQKRQERPGACTQ